MVRKTTKTASRPLVFLFLCILVVAAVLGGLGIPLVSSEGMVIRAHLVEGDLPTTPEDASWSKIPPMTLPLSGQVITRPVWPEPTARALTVRSLHNGSDMAFLLEWQDNTKNDRLTPGTFRDGVAIGLPLGDAPAFFCMGQLDHYINIWHWKADWQSDIDRRAARNTEKQREGVSNLRSHSPPRVIGRGPHRRRLQHAHDERKTRPCAGQSHMEGRRVARRHAESIGERGTGERGQVDSRSRANDLLCRMERRKQRTERAKSGGAMVPIGHRPDCENIRFVV